MERILLFGTMGEIGPTVHSHLAERGYEVSLVDFPQNVLHDEWGYCRLLRKSISALRPDAVMPIGNSIAISRAKSSLQSEFPGLAVCVEDERKVALLDSKVRLYALAESLGIRQPRLYRSEDELPPDGQTVIFKRDVSFGGQGVHMPISRKAIGNLIAHQRAGEPYLLEEYLIGTDWSIDTVRSAGRIHASAYRCTSGIGRNGPSTERVIEDRPELLGVAVKVLEELDYIGVCGFDFKVTEDGRAYLLEANPRFTGGIATQIEAGFDIPALLLEAWL
ncbi:MAG: ATP-grasp domain-containing protein [Bacteroidales bacterium]|nr:ATP-grasp domain-containing protein [Candidatus Cryptobacteroides aphodequi]